MERALVLGCGYVGLRLARSLAAAGHPVVGTTRDAGRAERLRRLGVEPLIYEAERPDRLSGAPDPPPDVAFHLIPPPRPADEGAASRAAAGLLALAERGLRVFVYASSTSVYGDRGGRWVAEDDEPAPDSPLGRARLAEERAVLEGARGAGVDARIARIAGIYGPGRTPTEAIRSGRYRAVRGLEAWSNRIHVDDLVAGLEAVWRRGRAGGTYNLSDGAPHRSEEYARLAAELAGLELASIDEAEAREGYTEARLARVLASRRVSNRRLTGELGVELRYASYREGLPAAIREERRAAIREERA